MPGKAIMAGMRVVDMTTAVFGPSATEIMGDHGAEVLKIEREDGDNSRRSGIGATPNMAAAFMALNRNKKCITLDLKDKSEVELVKRLVSKADVFVHNTRQAGIARMGLDYEAVKALNPKIIYVHCVGFGSGGPYSELSAYDELIQAASAFTALTGMKDKNPTPRLLPTVITDKIAGLWAAYATFAALFHRERTGEGQFVEVPLFETALVANFTEHLQGEMFVPPVGDVGYRYNLERDPFKTLDGYIAMFPQPRLWKEFAEWGGRPDLIDDPVYRTFGENGVRAPGVWRIHQEIAKNRTTDFWMDLFRKHGMPAMRVVDIRGAAADPHVEATGFFELRDHPTEGTYRSMRHPVTFSATPARVYSEPQRMNQDEAYIRALADQ
jgi:crotonobetainyl-CoA:carnitine CoA-transferase CaiB-like acyl-CoA transferase